MSSHRRTEHAGCVRPCDFSVFPDGLAAPASEELAYAATRKLAGAAVNNRPTPAPQAHPPARPAAPQPAGSPRLVPARPLLLVRHLVVRRGVLPLVRLSDLSGQRLPALHARIPG